MSGVFQNILCKPFKGAYPMSSRWGRRVIWGREEWHTGIDWAMPVGTPLYALEDGFVVLTLRDQFGGLFVDIKYSTHTVRYLHVSVFNVYPNTWVKQGQIVAYSGNTGLSSGPHLHLELVHNQNPAFIGIDPNTGVFDSRWRNVDDLNDMMKDDLIKELTTNKAYYNFPESTYKKLLERARDGDARFILDWSGAKPRDEIRQLQPFVRAFESLKRHAIWNRIDKVARQRINEFNLISIHTRWEAEKARRLDPDPK